MPTQTMPMTCMHMLAASQWLCSLADTNCPCGSVVHAGDIENLYSWSNTGACVKLFAPGVDIYGACGGASRCATLDDSSYTWASGTR
jgi:subtilisin family serine protease